MDPSAGVKEVADKLKSMANECGLDKVDQFIEKLEKTKNSASDGFGDALKNIEGCFKDFQKTLSNALDNPASLAPPGGMAACASWYGNAVAGKLKSFMDEITPLLDALKKLATDMVEPFKKLAETMKDVMAGLQGTVKGLTGLPQKVMSIADTAKSPEDVSKIDTADMKKSLDTSSINGPLSKLEGLKDVLGPVIDAVVKVFDQLKTFMEDASDKIKNAFGVPPPLCFMTNVLLSQAPPMMQTLLDQMENLKKVDMSTITNGMNSISDTVTKLDLNAVKTPINAFADKAGGAIGDLDGVVNAAKLAGGIPEVPKMW